MEHTPEQTASRLVAQLNETLSQNEDTETGIAVYKMANWIISELDEVKASALELAQQDMQQRELDALKTSAGSAGWTEPKTKQLNEQAWTEASLKDPRLMQIQRDFDLAQAVLHQAQEPFTELPEPRFYIR
ncbi:MAG: hypothetical protein M5U01_30335 [Ardenticatenaceae bacterium]|nr:hypothetical protein [Ardenticatenaceae bacterium]